MSNYTFDDVKRVLHEVIDERPQYVYEYPEGADECTYSDGKGGASCLIGQVIQRLDPEEFKQIAENEWGHTERWNDDIEADEELWAPVQILAVNDLRWAQQFTEIERQALYEAQDRQDRHNTWELAGIGFDLVLEGDAE